MSWIFKISWRHSRGICALILNNFRFLVCLSVCSLPHFLTEIRLSLDICSSIWAIFFQILGIHSWDVSALVQNNFRFLVCLSVCSLSHFLTEIMLTVNIFSSGWAIFLNFWQIFLVCCIEKKRGTPMIFYMGPLVKIWDVWSFLYLNRRAICSTIIPTLRPILDIWLSYA